MGHDSGGIDISVLSQYSEAMHGMNASLFFSCNLSQLGVGIDVIKRIIGVLILLFIMEPLVMAQDVTQDVTQDLQVISERLKANWMD
jgi:hypothetical protein